MFLAGKSGSLASKITTTCPPVTLQLTVPVTVYYVYVSIRVWHLIHPWTHDPDCSSHPTTHYLRNNIVYSWPAANLGKIDNCQSPLLLLSNLRMTTWITFWIFFSKIYVSSFHIWYLSTFFLSKPPQFELDSKVLLLVCSSITHYTSWLSLILMSSSGEFELFTTSICPHLPSLSIFISMSRDTLISCVNC